MKRIEKFGCVNEKDKKNLRKLRFQKESMEGLEDNKEGDKEGVKEGQSHLVSVKRSKKKHSKVRVTNNLIIIDNNPNNNSKFNNTNNSRFNQSSKNNRKRLGIIGRKRTQVNQGNQVTRGYNYNDRDNNSNIPMRRLKLHGRPFRRPRANSRKNSFNNEFSRNNNRQNGQNNRINRHVKQKV